MIETTHRRAAVNPKLLVTLVVVAVIAGGLWAYWILGASGQDTGGPKEYYLRCSHCKQVHTLPRAQAREVPAPDTAGRVQCTVCGNFAGRWVESNAPYVEEDEGPTNVVMP